VVSRRAEIALAVALALLAALSGCSLLGGGASTGSSPPPGVEDGRLVDADLLLEAHADQLARAGFRSELTLNATARQRLSGEVRNYPVAREQTLLVESGGTPYQFRTVNRRAGSRFDVWANDSRQYTRLSAGNAVRYAVGDPANTTNLAGVTRLEDHLRAAEYEVVETELRDGVRLYTLESGTVTDALAAMPDRTSAVEEYGATLVVDGDGRIRAMRVEATYRIGGERAEFDLGYTLTQVGDVTTRRPDWVGTAAGANANVDAGASGDVRETGAGAVAGADLVAPREVGVPARGSQR
jgi:hypothetical protein